ncbi:hypothetical protein DYB32_002889 [Aphanomyces invadans]|uniref:Serine aminopeptidase S33 domain-containing protein n=1 Tax=Aphanomyces invadans TaxID=157072 RepID=A0A3R7AC11_9STRA|nr:hypothetical protein DYB32_002889 [Aphanomyces invadans]
MDGAAVGMSSLHLPEISTLCDGTAQVYAVVALACVVSWIVFYRYTEQAGKVKLVFNGHADPTTDDVVGCSDGYRSFCADALEAGYRPVVFNKRGHGGSSLSVPLLQAFGCVKDMKEVIHHIQRLFPVAPIVGYDSVELFCNGGIRAPYDSILTYTLKHEDALSSVVDYAAAMQARSVAEFDRHVYMALHGYDDLASYWKHNNPMRAVENIAVPVLCINAKDDPVCTYDQINWSIFDINPNSMLAITTYGSHCGFFELTSGRKLKSWASKASLDYLSTALHYLHTSISSSKVKEQL